MNKAFIREPDATDTLCPRCESQGERVSRGALQHHLTREQLAPLTEPVFFCPSPRCAVAYFDGLEGSVLAADLQHPIYPKDPAAPICACFGVTRHEIQQDVEEGVVTRTRAAVQRAQSDEARCATLAANGRSCVAWLQKCYMDCRGEHEKNSR